MVLDVSSLREALEALNKSLGYLNSDLAKDSGLREQFRAAAIHAFKFTYELGVKMLKRQLQQIAASPDAIDRMTFMETIRTDAEAGLIQDIARFRLYRDMRNITSQTYNVEKAEQILSVLPDFAGDIAFLLSELERRNRKND